MEPESFRLLGESADVRVGIRHQGQESGLEVLVRVSPSGPAFRPAVIRDRLDRLDVLTGNGYRLTAQDGWWVVCEKLVAERELASEERSAMRLFADLLDGP